MPVPTWSVGQVLAAADVNSWFVPLAAIKTADQSVTSSTTFVSDLELLVPIVAVGSYQFECFLYYEGGTAGSSDLKWRWLVPTGTTMRYSWGGYGSGGTGAARVGDGQVAGDTPSAATNGGGVTRGVMMVGTIVAGVNAGNMQLQWAQNASSGTSTIVHAQSCLVLRRIA